MASGFADMAIVLGAFLVFVVLVLAGGLAERAGMGAPPKRGFAAAVMPTSAEDFLPEVEVITEAEVVDRSYLEMLARMELEARVRQMLEATVE